MISSRLLPLRRRRGRYTPRRHICFTRFIILLRTGTSCRLLYILYNLRLGLLSYESACICRASPSVRPGRHLRPRARRRVFSSIGHFAVARGNGDRRKHEALMQQQQQLLPPLLLPTRRAADALSIFDRYAAGAKRCDRPLAASRVSPARSTAAANRATSPFHRTARRS